ncbi:HlyD family secretion protein [gamma proteobacterium HdN1]|nr:HlyD family secretion protein [gamma proteobacterium HdN1]
MRYSQAPFKLGTTKSVSLLSAALLLTGTLTLAGCGEKTATEPTTKAALTITTSGVERKVMARTIEAQGLIAPWEEAILSARVSGYPLIEVSANVGDRVHRGQILARFDTRLVKAELAQARASLAQSEARARQSGANLERLLRMKGKGAVSEQDLQEAQTQADIARAQSALVKAQITTLEIRLADCEVRAVDDGVISVRNALLGQVTPIGTELFRLIRQDKLEWHAMLNGKQLLQVEPGQQVMIILQNGTRFPGKVRQLAPALDNLSRLGVAYVDIEPNPSARAGMFAGGSIALGKRESMVVPAEAVVLRDGRSTVFRLSEDQKVTQVPVQIGRRDGDVIEVIDGLSEDDQIAVRGAGFLVDGDQIRVVDSAPSVSINAAQLTQQGAQ